MTGSPLITVGSESEKGVVSALDDLFGPSFREVGEYLADKVKYHRLKSLQKILTKAKQFGPNGVSFIAPPPMKFLLPYIESSSLEDDDDDVMCSMWAKLLADASSEYDSKHLHFTRILKNITGKEAKLLHAIATESRIDPSIEGGWRNDIEFARFELNRSSAEYFLQRYRQFDTDKLAGEFIRTNEYPGSHISYIHVGERREDVGIQSADDDISGVVMDLEKVHGSLTFELLHSMSLIGEIRCEGVELGNVVLDYNAWFITSLGSEFYKSCTSAAFQNTSSAAEQS